MKKKKKFVLSPDGKKFFTDMDQDIHTTYGVLSKEEMKKAKDGDFVKTHKGKKFFMHTPRFFDYYSKMKRAAQIMQLKDSGYILAHTLVGKDSRVLDAGAGSGFLSIFLSRYVKKVFTCDIRDDHLKVVRENVQFLGIKNIEVLKQDVYEQIKQRNLELIALDLPEPHLALRNASKALKPGGFLVAYNPCITQINTFVDALEEFPELTHTKTIELIHRKWEVKGKKVRPDNRNIGHTGFMCFVRKIGK